MTVGEPTRLARAMTWLAAGLTVLLLAAGILWYGWSWQIHQRFWSDILGRADGPMTFRFLLQPVMGLLAAIPDGIRDARQGHTSFFWSVRPGTRDRPGRLRQGLLATARILLLGLCMDLVYQMRVFHRFYPAEAVLFSIALAVLPYFGWRWLVERIARGRLARSPSAGSPR